MAIPNASEPKSMAAPRYNPADYDKIYGLPLPAGQIRLLHVLPSFDQGANVEGVLTSYERDQEEFVAISYVWGDESSLESISLNGARFSATRNAHHVLKLLRGASTGFRPELNHLSIFANSKIWIDALCIDKANHEEKQDQVSQMQDIYKAAKRTLIWLGASEVESPWSRKAMLWFKDVVSSMPREKFAKGSDIRQYLWMNQGYESACHMMRQPWFRRRWIVQEATMSKDPLVAYGTQVLPWSVFNEAIERIDMLIADQMNKPNFQQRYPTNDFNPVTVRGVNRLRKIGVGQHSDLRLIDVLSEFRECNTSNPLDRIYALLGLCKEDERLGNRPNYQSTIADALIHLAVNHIRINKDLDILCVATLAARIETHLPNGPERSQLTRPGADLPQGTFIPDLPSWVPNLTSYYCSWFLGRDSDQNISNDIASVFNASSGAPADIKNIEVFDTDKTLLVSGIEIDVIKQTQRDTPISRQEQTRPDAPAFENMWHFARRHWTPDLSYEKDLDLLTAFFKTITAGGRQHGTKDFLTDAYLRHYCLSFFNEAEFGQMLISQHGYMPRPPQAEQYLDPSAGSKYNDKPVVLFDKLVHHCFACTRNGRMALVPPQAGESDRIFVVYGCTSPIVLRWVGGFYENIGEAYIHGFMFGEAIEQQKNNLLTKKTIMIK